jgi:hypothetical protein
MLKRDDWNLGPLGGRKQLLVFVVHNPDEPWSTKYGKVNIMQDHVSTFYVFFDFFL